MMKHVTAGELLDELDLGGDVAELAAQSGVDVQVKKLDGVTLLKLLVYGMLSADDLSLRVLQGLYGSRRFKAYARVPQPGRTWYSTLSDRLRRAEVSFFEQVCQRVIARHAGAVSQPYVLADGTKVRVLRFDSTLVRCSSKLIAFGMRVGRTPKNEVAPRVRQVKFTLGFDGVLPGYAQVHTAQSALSDEAPLAAAVRAGCLDPATVAVFDRGLKGRQKLVAFSQEGRAFITRTEATLAHEVSQPCPLPASPHTPTLEIVSDARIHLIVRHVVNRTAVFRLIQAKRRDTGEALYFLSNLLELSAADITEIYRLRWDIEVFFRFLKQEMNFSHLLSRDENGIRIMLYVAILAAALLMVYRERNQLAGFKLVKLAFANDLADDITRLLIRLCGGDVRRFDALVT